MLDVEKVLDEAGLKNAKVREYVAYWAGVTEPDAIEVVNTSDDARLVAESLEAGELFPAGEGLYYSRSYFKDTARSEERTIVATHKPEDKGVYNNWRDAEEMTAGQLERMRGQSRGKTMYVVPYLMAPPGSPLEAYAAGVELTDNRPVVLHMIRMARVGVDHVDNLADPNSFVRAVHVTGDLANLGQGTPEDQRYFVTVADERTILHFGSSYGGNALLGKIAHGLRQACYDGRASGLFLAEQFMLLGITDKETGKKYHVCGGFPSASGKTNLAMTLAPDAMGDRYHVDFYGDDIAWLWVGEDGKVYGDEPRERGLRRRQGHQRADQPDRARLHQAGHRRDLHQRRLQPRHPGGVVGGQDEEPARRRHRLGGLEGRPDRRPRAEGDDAPWAHPNSRFTTTLANVPNVAKDFEDPAGVPIDAIIFGGRTRDREPLVRAITDLAEGVYDGLTLGAEATFAADGLDGQLRYDPMSMRPFMAYGEADYAAHWLKIIGAATEQPIFAHVNWFQKDAERRPLPVARLPREPPPAAVAGQVQGRRGLRSPDARRRDPDRGGARPHRARPAGRRPRADPVDRRHPLARGDGLPRGAPAPVRGAARGDLGGPPPRGRRPRGGLTGRPVSFPPTRHS